MDPSLFLLVAIAFLEAIVLPFPPPDIIIIALSYQNPELWWFYALVSTAFSVLGGAVGFQIGDWAVRRFNIRVEKVEQLYKRYGSYGVLIGAISPLPFKIFSLGSGFFKLPLKEFLLSATVGRGLRFVSISYLASTIGEGALSLLEQNLLLVAVLIGVGAFMVKIIKDNIRMF